MCVYCAIGDLTFKVEGLTFNDEGLPGNFRPFVVEKAEELLFRLRVTEDGLPGFRDIGIPGEWRLVHVDKGEEADMPRLEIYKGEKGWLILMAMTRDGEVCAELEASSDFAEAKLLIGDRKIGDRIVEGERDSGLPGYRYSDMRNFAINNATMLLFAFTALKYRALEMHASVVVKGDRDTGLPGYRDTDTKERGFLFLGKSGTGKSTHSRLWMEAFEDAWLLNDDNPVVRLEDDGVWVYGSPWSGKTPCYKNARARVGAFVRLHQAAENSIEKARPSKAYIDVYSSCSGLKFMPEVRDEMYNVISEVMKTVNVFELDCLPNVDAALLCAAMCNV